VPCSIDSFCHKSSSDPCGIASEITKASYCKGEIIQLALGEGGQSGEQELRDVTRNFHIVHEGTGRRRYLSGSGAGGFLGDGFVGRLFRQRVTRVLATL